MSFSRMESVQQAVGLQFWGMFFEVFRATTRDTLQDCKNPSFFLSVPVQGTLLRASKFTGILHLIAQEVSVQNVIAVVESPRCWRYLL